MSIFKLSPSDFGFLYEECPQCFYMKNARGIDRPRTPMPKIFTKLDQLQKAFYHHKRTDEISQELPPGRVEYGERWVESQPVEILGVGSFYIRGRFDSVMRFDEGSYGIIDFKTSNHGDNNVRLYSRQIHAYAFALEHPGRGKLELKPITSLGLLCVEPVEVAAVQGFHLYVAQPKWVPIQRNDNEFTQFLREVVRMLAQPESPPPNPACPFCSYKNGGASWRGNGKK